MCFNTQGCWWKKLFLQALLSMDERKTLREFMSADIAIYDFFRAKLEHEILMFDKDLMRDSITEMKRLSKSLYDFCVLEKIDNIEAGILEYKVRYVAKHTNIIRLMSTSLDTFHVLAKPLSVFAFE